MIITRTPFRISFFGGGTDYPAWYEKNGGAVLSTSIDKYCHITCRELPPFFEKKHHIVYSRIENVDEPSEVEHPSVRECLKFTGVDNGLTIVHDGDLPAKSGMGSSSSFTVGLLHALYALQGRSVTKQQLALDAIHVEQERIKEHVGSQDQVAAAFGGFNRILFKGPGDIEVQPVLASAERLAALQEHYLLLFTGLSRFAPQIAVGWIKNTDRNEAHLRKMRELVDSAVEIVEDPTQDIREFGKLLDDTWQLKRGLTEGITNSTIDDMYDTARQNGAIGGKLLGAGAGGFMLLFVEPEHQDQVRRSLHGFMHVPFQFETMGSHILHQTPPGRAVIQES